jgi:hypothetical protein
MQKVDHRTHPHAVDDVSKRPAENQTQRHAKRPLPTLGTGDHPEHPRRCKDTHTNEKLPLPSRSAREKAECRPGISHVHQIHHGEYVDARSERNGGLDDPFRPLVGRNDHARKEQPTDDGLPVTHRDEVLRRH